jgi:hypothetical protein
VFLLAPKPNALAYLGNLQLQYEALVLSFFCEHLCLAANALRAFGLLIFALKPPEPNDTFLIRLVLGSLT